jgi:hypothetical protein
MNLRVIGIALFLGLCTTAMAQDFGTEWRFEPAFLVVGSIPVEINERLIDTVLPHAPRRIEFVDDNFIRVEFRDDTEIQGVFYQWKTSDLRNPDGLFAWYNFEFVDSERVPRRFEFVDNGEKLMLHLSGFRGLPGRTHQVNVLFSVVPEGSETTDFRTKLVDTDRLVDEGRVAK